MNEFNLDVVIPYNLVISFAKSSFHELCNVVNVGSMYGIVAPNPSLYDGSLIRSPVQYGVSKAALHHLTKELASAVSRPAYKSKLCCFWWSKRSCG